MTHHWQRVFVCLGITALLVSASCGAVRTNAASTPTYQHVFMILEENHSYNDVVGASDAPYINGTQIPNGATASNYHALTHPSQPNYLALISGSVWDNPDDLNPSDKTYPGQNIADELNRAGISWKAYMESMPSACDLGDDSGDYAVRHNPFMYYDEIRNNSAQCNRDVPYGQLAPDLRSASTTPGYAFISPNVQNDMHDGSVQQADSWLSQAVPAIQNSPACQSSACLIVTVWDEDDSSQGNQIPAIFDGPGVKANYKSNTQYNHYSLLRTVENNFGVAPMTSNDSSASPMSDMFGSSPISRGSS